MSAFRHSKALEQETAGARASMPGGSDAIAHHFGQRGQLANPMGPAQGTRMAAFPDEQQRAGIIEFLAAP